MNFILSSFTPAFHTKLTKIYIDMIGQDHFRLVEKHEETEDLKD